MATYLVLGEHLTVPQMAALAGVDPVTMHVRLRTLDPLSAVLQLKHRFATLVGRSFGRLTVTSYAGRSDRNKHMWHCSCSCGGGCTTIGESLRSGGTRSCGCLHRETARDTSLRRAADMTGLTFAGGNVRVLRRADGVVARGGAWLCECACGKQFTCPSSPLRRGLRTSCGCGITLAAKTIDRTKRDARQWIWNGVSHTLGDWARASGISPSTLQGRIKRGWDIGLALTVPVADTGARFHKRHRIVTQNPNHISAR